METVKIVCAVVVFLAGLFLLLNWEGLENPAQRLIAVSIGWIAVIVPLVVFASVIAKKATSW